MRHARIICGDVRSVLPTLPERSMQCCVTSPPYWGLRDYGCDGQLGLERTPEEYVANMVAVFREVRRVLRDDGVLWLNLGDCYATSPPGNAGSDTAFAKSGLAGAKGAAYRETLRSSVQQKRNTVVGVLKPKDLVGIPWRVAFALQADGWYLRSDMIWAKPNPMPESVTDRPTKAHEYVFLLTKSERYFYDCDAIREPLTESSIERGKYGHNSFGVTQFAGSPTDERHQEGKCVEKVADLYNPAGRNRRTVWTIATQPYSGAHFAVMPEDLVEPCIQAGSREGDTVLDPFTGSGTVGVVALKRGRTFMGVELNPKYAALAQGRINGDAPLLNRASVLGTPKALPAEKPASTEGGALEPVTVHGGTAKSVP